MHRRFGGRRGSEQLLVDQGGARNPSEIGVVGHRIEEANSIALFEARPVRRRWRAHELDDDMQPLDILRPQPIRKFLADSRRGHESAGDEANRRSPIEVFRGLVAW